MPVSERRDDDYNNVLVSPTDRKPYFVIYFVSFYVNSSAREQDFTDEASESWLLSEISFQFLLHGISDPRPHAIFDMFRI